MELKVKVLPPPTIKRPSATDEKQSKSASGKTLILSMQTPFILLFTYSGVIMFDLSRAFGMRFLRLRKTTESVGMYALTAECGSGFFPVVISIFVPAKQFKKEKDFIAKFIEPFPNNVYSF